MSNDNLTTEQLAKRWHMNPRHLANQRQAGNGPKYFRPAGGKRGRVLYRLKDIEDYEEQHLNGGRK